MADQETPDPSFNDLLADIMENPERLLSEDISPEQVLELQKRLNPYAYVTGDAGDADHKRSVAVSFTNLRAEYIQRFTMTSLVGYLFRMLNEWEVPAEARRWTSKAGAKRGKAEETARQAATPLTPDDIIQRAEALRDLAQIAKDAAVEATAATERVRKAEDDLRMAKATDVDAAELALRAETVGALFKQADGALAKSRGMQYAATFELRKFGLEADERIDAMAAVARQHPEVAAVINRDPIRRPTPGQIEIPADIAKNVISTFLRTWFEFNPDAHVRSAYDEFIIRKSVVPAEIEGLGAVPTDKSDPRRLPLDVVRANAPSPATDDRAVVDALTVSREVYNSAAYMLRNEQAAAALVKALEFPEKFRRYLFPIPKDSPARPAVDVIPPRDTFHRWQYYTEVNYEELRTATEAIYHEKPDLDFAIIVYEVFEGSPAEVDAAFEDFRDKHQDEVISDIKGLDFGSWTLLGDFKENREKISFYNKQTDVLKRILDRHAEDKKLGQDLMRNRVRQLKAKNIKEAGPDAPGLAEYKTQHSGQALVGMGAERVISREEMTRLERARGDIRAAKELEVLDQCRQTITDLSAAAKVRELKPEEERRLKDAQADLIRAQEMIEVPDDAIQVDVWTHDTKAKNFGKTKFYTKAEAPEHITEIQREQAAAMTAAGLAPPIAASATAARGRQANLSAPQTPAAQMLPPAVQTVNDLAPHAQHELARTLAASRLAATEKTSPPNNGQ